MGELKFKYFPEFEFRKAELVYTSGVKVDKTILFVGTYVRLEYEGVWYAQEVSERAEFVGKATEEEIIGFINRCLFTAKLNETLYIVEESTLKFLKEDVCQLDEETRLRNKLI